MELTCSMSRAQLHPISARLLPHHRLCEGDPGLLSTVQLMTVVVHQQGEWNQTPLPLPRLLGEWYGDKVAVPSARAQEPAAARTGTVVASGVHFGAK